MPGRYYRLLLGLAASISLSLAGCNTVSRPTRSASESAADPAAQQAVAQSAEDEWTEQTLWTWLGFAKLPRTNPGPHTGALVNPVLWEAAHDALGFAGIGSEDPVTGLLITKWYSPPGKPNERMRISVFILSRALRTTSLAATVQRQTRKPGGPWKKAPVAQQVADGIDLAILTQAQRIHARRYREAMYNQ